MCLTRFLNTPGSDECYSAKSNRNKRQVEIEEKEKEKEEEEEEGRY